LYPGRRHLRQHSINGTGYCLNRSAILEPTNASDSPSFHETSRCHSVGWEPIDALSSPSPLSQQTLASNALKACDGGRGITRRRTLFTSQSSSHELARMDALGQLRWPSFAEIARRLTPGIARVSCTGDGKDDASYDRRSMSTTHWLDGINFACPERLHAGTDCGRRDCSTIAWSATNITFGTHEVYASHTDIAE
jgi:hypothetical protein